MTTIKIKTVEELIHGNSTYEFTFGEWVQAHGWDVEKAVQAFDELFDGDGPYPVLKQPDAIDEYGNDTEDAVWDGGFALTDGVVEYVGFEGPCGSGVERKRVVLANDIIEMY